MGLHRNTSVFQIGTERTKSIYFTKSGKFDKKNGAAIARKIILNYDANAVLNK
jgi:hypothetical protein